MNLSQEQCTVLPAFQDKVPPGFMGFVSTALAQGMQQPRSLLLGVVKYARTLSQGFRTCTWLTSGLEA